MLSSTCSMIKRLQGLKDKVSITNSATVSFDFEVKKMEKGDWKSVPIIINSFNRKKYLQKQVSYLVETGYSNIYIIDNNSSYQPLLDFYQEQGLNVFYLSDNVGYLSLWQTPVFEHFMSDYYVYTDSDVVPCVDTPSNFIEVFAGILDKYHFLDKVGFSLQINNLPESRPLTQKIIEDEQKFWIYDIDDTFYFSSIDTTFALYRPNAKGGWWLNAGRVKEPFVAQHLPWYEEDKFLSEDDIFYYKSVNQSTRWSHFSRQSNFFTKLKSILTLRNK